MASPRRQAGVWTRCGWWRRQHRTMHIGETLAHCLHRPMHTGETLTPVSCLWRRAGVLGHNKWQALKYEALTRRLLAFFQASSFASFRSPVFPCLSPCPSYPFPLCLHPQHHVQTTAPTPSVLAFPFPILPAPLFLPENPTRTALHVTHTPLPPLAPAESRSARRKAAAIPETIAGAASSRAFRGRPWLRRPRSY